MSITNPFERRNTVKNEQANNDALAEEMGLSSNVIIPKNDKASENPVFDDYFEDDEETAALRAAKASKSLQQVFREDDDPVERALKESFDSLKKKYPGGGIKAARFITLDILLAAHQGYFKHIEEDIQKAVLWVQKQLIDKDRSEVIAAAQANPLDDAIQETAYRAVQSLTIEFLEKRNYRGVVKEILKTSVANEIIGFGPLDPLWRDRRIDEIIVNGPYDVQVEISGRLQKIPSVSFRDTEHLSSLISRLYNVIGKSVTRTTPLVKGRLHDNSRMFAVHESIAMGGPNFSIRRHPDKFWRPSDLVDRGSASKELMTSIGNLIHKGCSFVIIGGTSTGKTSLLNAMTGFYRNDVRLMTLEDNLEMKPNPNKLLAKPMECKPPAIDRPNDRGVTMRDLVQASTQLRPDGVIVGEVTDGAAYDLVQVLNTGHFGASTIHANSEFDGIYRISSLIAQSGLISAESALPLIASAFDFIIHLEHFPIDGSRRIVSISEVAPYTTSSQDGRQELKLNRLWRFVDGGLQDGKIVGDWEQVGEISAVRRARRHLDIEKDLTWDELQELSKI
jgi:pilus assembly protein CpaF